MAAEGVREAVAAASGALVTVRVALAASAVAVSAGQAQVASEAAASEALAAAPVASGAAVNAGLAQADLAAPANADRVQAVSVESEDSKRVAWAPVMLVATVFPAPTAVNSTASSACRLTRACMVPVPWALTKGILGSEAI